MLRHHGVRKGDRVCLYMPMIPELAYTMLACARIGAVHSIVFGGFSAESIRDRILDAGANVVVTANETANSAQATTYAQDCYVRINDDSTEYTTVQAAVDDAQKARNDSERFILEANEYANNIIPKARGDAARVLEDAQAYRDRKIADAEGEAARFESLLAEYQKAPRVTRDRLYIEAVEEVYSNTPKVLLDTDGSGNLLYLPLDQIMKRSGAQMPSIDATRTSDSQAPQLQPETRSRQETRDLRERRTRE